MSIINIILQSLLIGTVADTTISTSEVEISASFKTKADLQTMPLSSSSFYMKDIERRQIGSIADFATATPNLHIPDYGSKMTSSIYIRGIGSRIDNPAVGMYVDNVPYLNKNCFDSELWDVRRIDVLRGPQGTLYGRNTIGGIINIVTLSPLDYTGTRISMEAGNGRTFRASASVYQNNNSNFGYSIGISGEAIGGFFTNKFSGSKCDQEHSTSGRVRLVWRNLGGWRIDNTLTVEYSDEGGYAYAQYDTVAHETLPINYNDDCSYTRTHIADGLVAQRDLNNLRLQNVLSWQYLDDDMLLDNDFTVKDMFTLEQTQNEHTVSEEFIIRNLNKDFSINWLSGLSIFYKHNQMSAPVLFKRDGINELILDNANAGMQKAFPEAKISFRDSELLINSHFTTPVFGAGIFFQSEYKLGPWVMGAGLRIDFEHIGFDYHNSADLNYLFSMTMKDYKPLHTALKGKVNSSYLELLPKLSVQYVVGGQNIYATVARGFKSGGYNSQMFSDILQNQMKADLLGALGLYMDNMLADYTIDDVIGYKPEHNWNIETGAHLSLFDKLMTADVALFHIDCRDQQLTVFPKGKTTGRMMTNAGHSHSYGAEIALSANIARQIKLAATYGYTNATFTEYVSGNDDFAGQYVPYVPEHTVSVLAEYTAPIDGRLVRNLSLQTQYTGAGRIYWNESNSVWQDYYSQLSASASISGNVWNITLWGKNMTNTNFNNFYFVSLGNTFLSKGKPLQIGMTLKLYL